MLKTFYRILKNNFLVGLVALLPIYVTIRVVLALLHHVDQFMAPYLQDILQGRQIPGLGAVVTFLLITLAGFLMKSMLFRKTGTILENLIASIPFVRTIYTSVKQVLQPLLGDDRHKAFKHVVAFEWPGNGIWVMGFLVKEPDGEPSPDDDVLVFLPTNHLHLGFVLALKRSKLRILDMSIEEALRTQFSLGVAAPDHSMMGNTLSTGLVRAADLPAEE